MGRKVIYGPDVRELILSRIAAGETLRAVCRDEGMPEHQTVIKWALEDKEFGDRYARARSMCLQVQEDILLAIADDSDGDVVEREREDGSTYEFVDTERIARAKLRIDTRKWLMSKLRPDKYGDRVTQEITGAGGGPLKVIIHDSERE